MRERSLPRKSLPFLLAAAFLTVASVPQAPAAAQAPEMETYTISGTVVSAATGQPLSEVQVSIRNTSIGTLTNAQGRFRLNATLEEGTWIVAFTYLGRRTETRTVTLTAAAAPVDLGTIELSESAVELDEIVVVTTGVTSERRAVGNSIESVRGAEVNEAAGVSTIDQALQGRITGAVISENSGQPGGGMSIRLRGTSSILGGGEPLIVVDGVILDNTDEALVSLSANATRGSAALTNRLGDLVPSDIERIEVLKGAAAAALYGSRANNGVIQIFTRSGQQGAPRVTVESRISISETPERYDLIDYPFAGLADAIWGPPGTAIGDPVTRFDYQDEMWQTGLGLSQYASVSGGTEGTTYYFSGTWGTQEGILRNSEDERLSLRGKLSQRIGENLEVGFNVNIVDKETVFIPEGEQTFGTLTGVIFQPNSFDLSFDPDLGRYPFAPLLQFNPLQVIDQWEQEEDVTRIVGNVNADYWLTDDLSLRYTFGIDDYRNEFRSFVPPGSTPNGTGSVQNPIRMSRQFNHDLTATWEPEDFFREGLGLSATAGFRYTQDHQDVVRAAVNDLPPGLDIVSGATQFASQGITEIRTMGGFAQSRFDWEDRIFLTLGLSAEGSSAFGEDQRWQLFPKANVSWILSDEAFMADQPWLSTLRLRAAYGETGGQPPGAYLRFDNYIDVGYDGRAGLIGSNTAGNPDLEPERQREWEGGFDLGLFDDRALVELTYYDKRTEDLVLPVPQPPSTGVQTRFENVGVVTNTGWELALSTVNVTNERLTWRSRIQFATNDNMVEELVAADDTLFFGYLNIVTEGQPLGVFYGRYSDRDEEGNLVINPATGLPGLETVDGTTVRRVLGNPHPDWTASLHNQLSLGERWQVDFLLEGRFGNEVANFTRRITEFFGTDAKVAEEIRRRMAIAAGEDVDPLVYTLNGAVINNYERFVEDGSFIKLREIGVRYRLPGRWLEPVGASEGSLRIAGRNLYTWTDYSGLDPEINLFAGNTVARGVDFANTPIPRTFEFTVNLGY